MIKIKRIYEEASADDGYRILVDRLWPRGVSKDRAKIDLWLKNIAPSEELRKYYCHDPAKWEEFRVLYFKELFEKNQYINSIIEKEKNGMVTLLFASKNEKENNAVVLKEFLDKK